MTTYGKGGGRHRRTSLLLICLLAAYGVPRHACADESATIATPVYLGDWLVDHLGPAAASPLFLDGLIWQSGSEVYAQEQFRQRLLTDIGALRGVAAAQRQGMAALISSRAATGRVPVKHSDPRWLQANRASDPLLEHGDKVTIPTRPHTVTVIRADGSLCVQPHVPNAEALHYVRACNPKARPDWAWVAQPDGTVERDGVALWNRNAQDLPAPGAWIWAPDRHSWPESVSARIAAFFATQGAAVPDTSAASPQASSPSAVPAPEPAPSRERRARDLPATASDWGDIGLLQTPTARMAEAGDASMSLSNVSPYTRLNVVLQPLDWFEFAFRYTDVTDQPYGPVSLSGTQTYKDKSIDARFRLWQESAWLPAVAVGFRDLGGTGLFSGQYVVGSKRTGDFDWSLGLGWGYVGARGSLPDPFSVLSPRFKQQQSSTGAGTGNFSLGSYFRGRTSLFGGVQYQTPWDKLLLKLEYDGNDYQHEPFGVALHDRSPFNVGAVYRATKHVDLSVGYERGDRVMLGVAIHGSLKRGAMPKIGDPLPLPVVVPAADAPWQTPSNGPADAAVAPPASAAVATAASTANAASATDAASPAVQPQPAPAIEPQWARIAADIEAQTGWRVTRIHRMAADLLIEIDNPNAFYLRDHLERIANVLNRDAIPEIRTFHILPTQWGMPVAGYTIRRSVWVDSHARALPPSEQASAVVAEAPISTRAVDALPEVFEQPPKRFDFTVGPGYQQSLGGPNGFLLYQLSADAQGELRLAKDAWIGGGVNVGLANNYGKFTYDAPSALPRVRTYVREYVTSSRVTIPFLQLTKVGKVGASNYYSLYGGLLESMFAGVGGEWLYRPWDSRLAIGVDANEVQQRGFRQDFALRDYRTMTGHLTFYWDTGWNGVQANVSIGRYLAKDYGATFDVSRTFQNGVTIGAYATKTNVSAAQFGEGSFDKGVYVKIPFDAMMTRSSADVARLDWHPLTRDGGAKLDRQYPLYDLTRLGDPRSLWYGPPAAGQ